MGVLSSGLVDLFLLISIQFEFDEQICTKCNAQLLTCVVIWILSRLSKSPFIKSFYIFPTSAKISKIMYAKSKIISCIAIPSKSTTNLHYDIIAGCFTNRQEMRSIPKNIVLHHYTDWYRQKKLVNCWAESLLYTFGKPPSLNALTRDHIYIFKCTSGNAKWFRKQVTRYCS